MHAGSNELESIQQTTAAINDRLNTVLPTMTDQFAATQRQLAELQRSISELQQQIAPLLVAVNSPTKATPLRTKTTTTSTNGYSNFQDVPDSGLTLISESKTAAADAGVIEGGCRLRSSAGTSTDISVPLLPTYTAATSPPLIDVPVTSGATADDDVSGRCFDVNVTCPTTSRRVKKAASATVGSRESSWRVSSLLHRQNATTSDECSSPDGIVPTDHVIWRQQSESPSASQQLRQHQVPSSASLSQTAKLPMTVEEQANAEGRFSSETVFTFTL